MSVALRERPSPGALGRRAEDEAAAYLRVRGYRVVARNVRCRAGEVDIVAYEGEVLCFVEVRSRSSCRYGTPAETVTAGKQARITRAAAAYLAGFEGAPPRCRFDVVTLTGRGARPAVALLRGAFEASS